MSVGTKMEGTSGGRVEEGGRSGSYFGGISVIAIYFWKKSMEKNYGVRYYPSYLVAPSA